MSYAVQRLIIRCFTEIKGSQMNKSEFDKCSKTKKATGHLLEKPITIFSIGKIKIVAIYQSVRLTYRTRHRVTFIKHHL